MAIQQEEAPRKGSRTPVAAAAVVAVAAAAAVVVGREGGQGQGGVRKQRRNFCEGHAVRAVLVLEGGRVGG